MRHVLSWLLLFAPFGAYSTPPEDPLARYYSASERERIMLLVDFFDKYVAEQTGEESLQRAYEIFHRQQAALEVVTLTLPSDTVRAVFARLGLPVWNSIWTYGAHTVYRPRDSVRLIVPLLDLRLHGTYWKFLGALAKEDEQLARYTKTIQAGGSLSPTLQGLYFERLHAYPVDYTQTANRLVAAVHYLTYHVQQLEQPQ